MNEEQQKSFAEACEPLVKWFNDNPTIVSPHSTAIVTYSSAELLDGRLGVKFDHLVKD